MASECVSVVGLGYVGLTLATVLADADFDVIGLEIRNEVLDALAEGRAHFHEAGIDERIRAHLASGKLRVRRALGPDDRPTVYVITVGTPIGPDKRSRIDSISAVARMISQRLRAGDMVILRSTVRIGVTRDVVKPILDQARVPYSLAFCPERTIEGKALAELRELPQIVGGLDEDSCQRAAALFAKVTREIIPVASLEAAEMVKLINNTERDLKFAFANEIAAMCDVLGLSAAEVIRSCNHHYPRSSLALPGPVGGPCLTKDPYILAEGLATHGLEPRLALLGREINEATINAAVASVGNALDGLGASAPRRIAVLGLAFKGRPATDDLRGSTVFDLLHAMRQRWPRAEIVGYDPIVPHGAVVMELGITPVASIEAAFADSAVVFLHNNHPDLSRLPLTQLGATMARPAIVYDFWGQNTAGDALPEGVFLAGLGQWPATLPAVRHAAAHRHVA